MMDYDGDKATQKGASCKRRDFFLKISCWYSILSSSLWQRNRIPKLRKEVIICCSLSSFSWAASIGCVRWSREVRWWSGWGWDVFKTKQKRKTCLPSNTFECQYFNLKEKFNHEVSGTAKTKTCGFFWLWLLCLSYYWLLMIDDHRLSKLLIFYIRTTSINNTWLEESTDRIKQKERRKHRKVIPILPSWEIIETAGEKVT